MGKLTEAVNRLSSSDLTTTVAWFTSPVPVSVNNGIDFTSTVISVLVT